MDAPRPTSDDVARWRTTAEGANHCECAKESHAFEADSAIASLVTRVTDLEARNEKLEALHQAAKRVVPGVTLRTLPGIRGMAEDEMDTLTAAVRRVESD